MKVSFLYILSSLIIKMKVFSFCALIFALFFQQTLSSLFTFPVSREQLAEMAKEKTKCFTEKVLRFINKSSNMLCMECFKRDVTKLLWCLSQPPLPNRVVFIRQRCPIPVDLYSNIINQYIQMKQQI